MEENISECLSNLRQQHYCGGKDADPGGAPCGNTFMNLMRRQTGKRTQPIPSAFKSIGSVKFCDLEKSDRDRQMWWCFFI